MRFKSAPALISSTISTFIDGHKGGIFLLLKQPGNVFILDDCVGLQAGNETDRPSIPLGDLAVYIPSQQMLIQNDHQAVSSWGRDLRNCVVIRRMASMIACLDTLPR